jgi:hypothetical protein
MVFTNARREKGLRAKNPKLSRLGLILGAPLEVGVGSSVEMCGNSVDEVLVVVQYCVHKCEAGEGAEGQKIETEP